MNPVIVANSALEPMRQVSWQDAAIMLVRGVAMNLDGSEIITVVHSEKLEIPVNRIIYTVDCGVFIPGRTSLEAPASRGAILKRDKNRCGYCGEKGTTIDHIIPKSRGGLNVYGNLVGCCVSCNSKKGNLTPQEAGMELIITPTNPLMEAKKEIMDIFKRLESG